MTVTLLIEVHLELNTRLYRYFSFSHFGIHVLARAFELDAPSYVAAVRVGHKNSVVLNPENLRESDQRVLQGKILNYDWGPGKCLFFY